MKRIRLLLPVVAGLVSWSAVANAQDKTEWLIAPYLWAPSITFNQEPDDGSGTGEDILEKIDAAGLIRIEAANGNWGGSLDYIFVSLADTGTIDSGGPLPTTTNSDMNVTVLELAGFYRLSGRADGAHLLFGYRGIDIETTLLFTPPGSPTQRYDTDETLNDIFLGARYLLRFNDRWDFTIRGDYSFGDTDGVVNAITSVGFRFNEAFAVNLGYRYSDLKYETTTDNGTNLSTEVEFSGFLVGLLFRF